MIINVKRTVHQTFSELHSPIRPHLCPLLAGRQACRVPPAHQNIHKNTRVGPFSFDTHMPDKAPFKWISSIYLLSDLRTCRTPLFIDIVYIETGIRWWSSTVSSAANSDSGFSAAAVRSCILSVIISDKHCLAGWMVVKYGLNFH